MSPASQPWRRRVKEEIAFLSRKNFQPTNLFPKLWYFILTSNSNIQQLNSLNTFVVPPCLHTHLPDDSQPAFSMALTWSSMEFQSSEIFLNITLKTSISRVGVLSSEISVSLQGIRMLLVSWGMGHGVNIALGKIGYASPVKWDNASLPCTALHQSLMPPSTPLNSVLHCTERFWRLFPHFPELNPTLCAVHWGWVHAKTVCIRVYTPF